MQISLNTNTQIQSKQLFLQAAGSTGSDGSQAGIHLRWELLRNLGQTHIPKGVLANPSQNDAVKVYRAPYTTRYPVVVNVLQDAPSVIIGKTNTISIIKRFFAKDDRIWIYQGDKVNTDDVVYIHFKNKTAYDAISIDPVQNHAGFLKAYGNNLIEVQVKNKLCFAANIYLANFGANPELKLETISTSNNDTEEDSRFVSSRTVFDLNRIGGSCSEGSHLLQEQSEHVLQENLYKINLENSGGSQQSTTAPIVNFGRIVTENIQSLRFTVSNATLSVLHLETYDNFLQQINTANKWEQIGESTGFGLTTNDEIAYKRLEKNVNTIHNKWKKYKDATINIANYKTRWGLIRKAIIEYIDLSGKDPNNKAANIKTPANEGSEDEAINISYFMMLKIASYDYHVARMLGLGYIDNAVANNFNAEYIYAVAYDAPAEVGSGRHIFLTPPINCLLEKKPTIPELKPLRYGIKTALSVTDSNGYTYDGKARYIALHVDTKQTEYKMMNFFASSQQFCYHGETETLFVGIGYKSANETAWRKKSITSDKELKDTEGNPEVSAIPAPIEPSVSDFLFNHKETETGIHNYAVYAVNWFSRTSDYSNTRNSNNTQFTVPNKLLPPQNLQAHIIQKENNLLLTTPHEQELLQKITSNDKTLLRVTFEYTHSHDITHQYGDTVQLFFRTQAPRSVTGFIKQVEKYTAQTSKVITTAYTHLDIDGKKIEYSGIVPPVDYARYIGGILTVKNRSFVIEQVLAPQQTGYGSVFIVRNIEERIVQNLAAEPALPNYQNIATEITPFTNEVFTVIENMADVQNWYDGSATPTPLACEVQLTDIGQPQAMWNNKEEIIVPRVWNSAENKYVPGNENSPEKYKQIVRGINENARIEPTPEKSAQGVQTHIGVYTVTFNNTIHRAHPQSGNVNPVDWYKGFVRVRAKNDPWGDKKVLDVLQILSSPGQKLSLLVFDNDFTANPIKDGASVEVNYYPGYRLYLYADAAAGLTARNILPAANEDTRHSYLSARTLDKVHKTVAGIPYSSKMCTPKRMFALELQEPLAPQKPAGGRYATRPDFYNKSTYTCRVTCNSANPYALVFLRASERMLLEAVYEPATISKIEADLAALGDDEYFTSRWENFVDFETLLAQNIVYTKYNGYQFPKPDKRKDSFGGDLFNKPEAPEVVIKKLKEAIYSSFLPLTEQPLIYEYIKSAASYVPSHKKQTIRDMRGDLLEPTDPEFDQSPMAKIVDVRNKIVQFTDFTLDGASKNFYFYCAMELCNRMQFSDKSPIFGPIQMVNTAAPGAPKILNITSVLQDPDLEVAPEVVIELCPYPQNQEVTRFQLYRTTKASHAMSPRSMQKVKEITVEPESETITISDDFSFDNGKIPYGDALYYKVIALRKIRYANNAGEEIIDYVPSLASKTVLTLVIDTESPVAPELTFSPKEPTEGKRSNCKLLWDNVIHNATYHIYKMNDAGNWNLLHSLTTSDEHIEYMLEEDLYTIDDDETPIYHRFKVEVENSSGLWSTNDNTIII
ncbi:MAG: hypothetical protein FWC39_12610 [Bacteroidetes bacterium]|nr:hypothetical protein [Bacteroidota bacterium]